MPYYNTEKLELPKILSRLESMCASSLGKDLVARLAPSADLEEVRIWQQETTEACDCLRLYPTFSLGGIRDIRTHLWRVARGGVLQPGEFLDILDTVQAGRRLKSFFAKVKEDYPRLKELSQELMDLSEVEKAIISIISEDGKVKDEASPALFRFRRKIQEIQEKIKNKLEGIIRSGEYQRVLQDALITMRGDRYVLPVKQEYRSKMPGLVHDQSASGATLFIEPMAVVELNNELRKAQLEEAKEVETLLVALSARVGSYAEELQVTVEALGKYDFLFAKARLSGAMNASQPSLNKKGYLRIVKGRHPLLTGKPVPLDLELGEKFRTLIITGPNTGGKTVALKTCGLLCLMAQCGLHVPAEPETELCVFEQIFADIGDEQSIEQSLSTFSSHMKNLVSIVQQAGPSSLVLLDELGAGTDPTEGAALAMAILSTLHSAGARIVATTHYSELKAFAYNTAGMENASVEFDPISLRPTYRLLIGMPGRSNALEIAARLGLDPDVVALARSYISQDELEVGALLEELETRRLGLEREQDESERLQRELAQLKKELEVQRLELHRKEQRVLEEAQVKAKKIIDEAQEVVRSLVADLRRAAKERERREQDRAIEEARRRLHELKRKNRNQLQSTDDEYKRDAPTSVRPGDPVYVVSLNQKGTVLTEPNPQGEVQVQVGIMKVQVALADLRLVERDVKQQVSGTVAKMVLDKARSLSPELDLRGCTVEEALELVEKYLDDALLSNLTTIYLIHGKGTGALRSAITNLLQNQPNIKSFRLGYPAEGGSGVTVVEFK